VGWWNHGIQIPSQNPGKGKASCQGSCSEDVLERVSYILVALRLFIVFFNVVISLKTFVFHMS